MSEISRLPCTVLGIVLGFLSVCDVLTTCRQVCAEWKNNKVAWTSIDIFGDSQKIEADHLRQLLQDVIYSNVLHTFCYSHLSNDGIQVRRLTLDPTWFIRLKRLNTLRLHWVKVKPCERLCGRISELKLDNCCFTRLPRSWTDNLLTLELIQYRHSTRPLVAVLRSVPMLHTLVLNYVLFYDKHLPTLSFLRNLKVLSLRHIPITNSQVLFDSTSTVTHMTLSYNDINDYTAPTKPCALQHLDIRGYYPNNLLAVLQVCPALTSLRSRGGQVAWDLSSLSLKEISLDSVGFEAPSGNSYSFLFPHSLQKLVLEELDDYGALLVSGLSLDMLYVETWAFLSSAMASRLADVLTCSVEPPEFKKYLLQKKGNGSSLRDL